MPKNRRHKRLLPLWKVYHWMCHYHTVYLFSNAIAHLDRRDNFGEFSWFLMIALEVFMGHVKDFIVAKYTDEIEHAQHFLNKQATIVLDSVYDRQRRKSYFRKIQIVCAAIGLVSLNMLLMMTIPSAQIDELFALSSSIPLSNVLYYFFKFTISPAWPCKIISSTALITSILDGFKTEMMIFANDLESTVQHSESSCFGRIPVSGTQRNQNIDEDSFRNLQHHIYRKISRHVELLE